MISGTSGFLGGALARKFKDEGWFVYGMGRRKGPEDAWIKFALGEELEAIPEADVFIHAAYDFTALAEGRSDLNLRGSLQIFDFAWQHCRSATMAFVSSLSSHEGARSHYGRTKYEIEQRLLRKGILCFRPGLIIGADATGVAASLTRLVEMAPVVPVLGAGDYPLYLCDVQQVVNAMFERITSGTPTAKPIVIARSEPTSLVEFLRQIARDRGLPRLYVHIPATLVMTLLKLAERIGFRLPFRSDSAIGLIDANTKPWHGTEWIEVG